PWKKRAQSGETEVASSRYCWYMPSSAAGSILLRKVFLSMAGKGNRATKVATVFRTITAECGRLFDPSAELLMFDQRMSVVSGSAQVDTGGGNSEVTRCFYRAMTSFPE